MKKPIKNLHKLLFLFTLALVASLGLTSCSDDDIDKVSYPHSIKYVKSEITEFKMYIGSENGGKEVSTAGLDPAKYWPEDYLEDLDTMKGISIEYKDKENAVVTVTAENKSYSSKYKFEKGELLLINEENQWETLAYGDIKRIKMHTAFSKICKYYPNGNSVAYGGEEEHVSLNDLLGKDRLFESLSDMKYAKDTIMWCNLQHIYE